jgi:hypothetical protein
MKKRILSFVVALLCMVPGFFVLTACQHVCKTETKWSHDDTHHWYACEVEGCLLTKDQAEHEWDNGVVTTNATYLSNGVKTFTCKVCLATKTEEIVYNKTVTFDWNNALNFNGVDNLKYTCLANGVMAVYEICGETIKCSYGDEISYYTIEDGEYYEYWQHDVWWYKCGISEDRFVEMLPEVLFGVYAEENFAKYKFNQQTEMYEGWQENPNYESYLSFAFKNGLLIESRRVNNGCIYMREYYEYGNVKVSAPKDAQWAPE